MNSRRACSKTNICICFFTDLQFCSCSSPAHIRVTVHFMCITMKLFDVVICCFFGQAVCIFQLTGWYGTRASQRHSSIFKSKGFRVCFLQLVRYGGDRIWPVSGHVLNNQRAALSLKILVQMLSTGTFGLRQLRQGSHQFSQNGPGCRPSHPYSLSWLVRYSPEAVLVLFALRISFLSALVTRTQNHAISAGFLLQRISIQNFFLRPKLRKLIELQTRWLHFDWPYCPGSVRTTCWNGSIHITRKLRE